MMEHYCRKGVPAKRSTHVASIVSVETLKLSNESGKGHIRKVRKRSRQTIFLKSEQQSLTFLSNSHHVVDIRGPSVTQPMQRQATLRVSASALKACGIDMDRQNSESTGIKWNPNQDE